MARRFGTEWVATLFGLAVFGQQIGGFLGASLAGVIWDRTGSHDGMWAIAIRAGAFATAVNLPVLDPRSPLPARGLNASAARFAQRGGSARLAPNHAALTQRNDAVRRLLIALALAFTPLPATGQGEPHAWLFGSWTGGTRPANPLATTQACYADPTVIFTRDIVLRTTLLDPTYTQRIIETVRATETGAEFRFRPMPRLPGVPAARQPTGTFGCASPDVLTVVRLGPNEIEFPGCTEFPSPLVRCPVP